MTALVIDESFSLQGHPRRFAIDSEDVLDEIADRIANLDFDALHAQRQRRIDADLRAKALKELRSDAGRPGQLSADETPCRLKRKGVEGECHVYLLEGCLDYDLDYAPEIDGMRVFKFWNVDQPVYVAALADTVNQKGHIQDWHVELYHARRHANAEIRRREIRIKKRIGYA